MASSDPNARAAAPGVGRRAAAFFAFFAVATHPPAVLLVNRIEPRIGGLPFVLVWICAWIVGAGLVLWSLERGERR